MARIAGTRFIERGAHQSETVLVQLREDLALGRTIMIFPEGTTTDGRDVLRFHPRLFGIAQSSGVRLQPVAIRYQRGTDPTPDQDVPYVGEDTLIANLWRLMRHPGLIACVHFLPPIQADRDERRRALAERARRMIVEALDSAEGAPANDRSEAATETAASAIGLDPRPA
jgi:1-acyl-sn-glycerol-3-phosphate acyltransferase